MTNLQLFNVTAELDQLADDLGPDQADELLARFADYSPVVARSELGRADLIISLPAATVWQATATARALADGLGVTRLTVESAEDFDRRSLYGSIPPLVGVTEAAQALGITRAAVQKRIDAGRLPAQKIGNTGWVIPAAAVHQK